MSWCMQVKHTLTVALALLLVIENINFDSDGVKLNLTV